MRTFEDIPLNWQGKPYTVPANRVMGAIARLEDIITLQELTSFGQRGLPFAKLAMGYGAVLRYAGAKAEDDEVYFSLFESDKAANVAGAVAGLLAMMLPPSLRRGVAPKGPPMGNGAPTGARSSKRRTRQRSENGG